jgi:3-oxoadipate enol-lactonase
MNEVRTDDGCTLKLHELRASRQSKQPPILFIHALAMDGLTWARVAAAVRTNARLLALDCRGHGASGKPAGPYATERFARDIVNVLDAINAPAAVIVGCSMGGTVAQAFAGLYPKRCAGLVLIDTTAWYGPDAPKAWEGRAAKAENEGLQALVEFQSDRWLSAQFKEEHPDVLEDTLRVFLANDIPAYAATCRMLGVADERARLSNYHGPAEVIVGEHDYATPIAMHEDIVGRLPGSHLTVIPGARHFTPMERPDAIAERVDALFANQQQPAGTNNQVV